MSKISTAIIDFLRGFFGGNNDDGNVRNKSGNLTTQDIYDEM